TDRAATTARPMIAECAVVGSPATRYTARNAATKLIPANPSWGRAPPGTAAAATSEAAVHSSGVVYGSLTMTPAIVPPAAAATPQIRATSTAIRRAGRVRRMLSPATHTGL